MLRLRQSEPGARRLDEPGGEPLWSLMHFLRCRPHHDNVPAYANPLRSFQLNTVNVSRPEGWEGQC